MTPSSTSSPSTRIGSRRRNSPLACYTGLVYGRQTVPEVGAHEVADDIYLLDVREIDEWSAGHAPGAVLVPMMQIPGRLTELPRDRDIVVVCRVGARSAQVVAFLRAQGWDRVSNLSGGMLSWHAGGRALVSEDGSPARVV